MTIYPGDVIGLFDEIASCTVVETDNDELLLDDGRWVKLSDVHSVKLDSENDNTDNYRLVNPS